MKLTNDAFTMFQIAKTEMARLVEEKKITGWNMKGLEFKQKLTWRKSSTWLTWKWCLYAIGHDNEKWDLATAKEFEPISKFYHYILTWSWKKAEHKFLNQMSMDEACIIVELDYRHSCSTWCWLRTRYSTLLFLTSLYFYIFPLDFGID